MKDGMNRLLQRVLNLTSRTYNTLELAVRVYKLYSVLVNYSWFYVLQ